MKVYSKNSGKILAKIYTNDDILPIFLSNFIKILASMNYPNMLKAQKH